MTDLSFNGETILVIGGSSGIGNGIAQAFNTRGAAVYVWGTRPGPSDYTDSNMEGLNYQQMDVADFDRISNYQPPFEKLDTLVLSQGTVLYKRQEFEMPGWSRVMDVNLNSVMACAQKFFPLLKDSQGQVVTVSSTAGFNATRGNPAYAASKSGLVGLTKTLGEAWAKDGIRVNGVAPGFVDTKLTKVTTENPERLETALRAIPMKRLGTPEDIANVVLFLASPLSRYICGQTIIADGGLTLS